jgi:carboxymethylenebutenolidase
MGEMTRFPVPDGKADAYLATPAASPAVPMLLLHAWWGLKPATREFADRLAGDGFIVLAPDLFDGTVLGSIEEAEAHLNEIDSDKLIGRVNAALDALLARPEVTVGSAAVAGFSLGAGYGTWLAALRPEVAAVVNYYGGGPEPPGNPEAASRPAYLGHWAEDDPYEDSAAVPALIERLAAEDPRSAAYVYEGTRHWFAEPDRNEYNEEAAELAYRRTVEFLRANVR